MNGETCKEDRTAGLKAIDRVVKKIATERGYDDCDLATTALNSGGGNYMGDLFAVDVLQGGKETLHLFAKVSNTSEKARVHIPTGSIYEREISAYTTIAAAFRDLQAEHQIPHEQMYQFAEYYGSDLTEMEEILVLENLAKKGYGMYDRCRSMDWEYAAAALRQLAKFHALSFALEIEKPELFDELVRSKKEFFINRERPAEIFKAHVDSITKMALDALEPQYVEGAKKYCDGFHESWPAHFRPSSAQSVLVHGDYRISNHMVKYEEGKLTSLIPLDYQTIFYGSPINDIIYLLISGSDEEFRREHYEDYIQHYYDELTRALAALQHRVQDVYPKTLYLQHVREKLLYGLGVAVFMLPIMTVEAAAAPKISDMVEKMDAGGDGAPSIPGNALYAARLNGIFADMRRWGVLDALP